MIVFLCLDCPVNLFRGVSENFIVPVPVKEIAVADGHIFVLHEGEMLTQDEGNVTVDYPSDYGRLLVLFGGFPRETDRCCGWRM